MNFYILQNPKINTQNAGADFLPIDGSPVGEAARCNYCGRYYGMLPLLPPVRIELEVFGGVFGDFVFGPADELIVSDHFIKLCENMGLIGLVRVGIVEILKFKLHQKMQQTMPTYHCVRVAHSITSIDDARSGLERDCSEICAHCRLGGIIKRAKRIIVEPDSWAGEDVFVARGLPGIILVTDRFEKICQQNKILNCNFIPAEHFSFDHYAFENKN